MRQDDPRASAGSWKNTQPFRSTVPPPGARRAVEDSGVRRTMRAEGSAASMIAEGTDLGEMNAGGLRRMRTPAAPVIGGKAVRLVSCGVRGEPSQLTCSYLERPRSDPVAGSCRWVIGTVPLAHPRSTGDVERARVPLRDPRPVHRLAESRGSARARDRWVRLTLVLESIGHLQVEPECRGGAESGLQLPGRPRRDLLAAVDDRVDSLGGPTPEPPPTRRDQPRASNSSRMNAPGGKASVT